MKLSSFSLMLGRFQNKADVVIQAKQRNGILDMLVPSTCTALTGTVILPSAVTLPPCLGPGGGSMPCTFAESLLGFGTLAVWQLAFSEGHHCLVTGRDTLVAGRSKDLIHPPGRPFPHSPRPKGSLLQSPGRGTFRTLLSLNSAALWAGSYFFFFFFLFF